MAKAPPPEARVFPVDTRFQKMARREGGVSREKAIEQAQSAIEEVKPRYDEWLDTELKEFAGLIKSAQSGKAEPNWIETANFRSRQLRDSATPLGFELLAFIANSLCEICDSIEAGSECNMESIACHLDALLLARQKSYRHLKPEQVPDLTKGLRRVVKRVTV
jgi:hypothetical protein